MMRPMVLEFPDDPAVRASGAAVHARPRLLVAPVFDDDGRGRVLPAGGHLDPPAQRRSGDRPALGARDSTASSVPLLVRPGAVIPVGAVDDRPEYDWSDNVELRWFAPTEGQTTRATLPDAMIELTLHNGQPQTQVIKGTCDRYTVKLA